MVGERSVFLFCVCTVLHREILQSVYLTISPSGWSGSEWTPQPMPDLRNISREDLLPLIFFHVLNSFSFTYTSVFLSAARLTNLEGLHQKQQLHKHLLSWIDFIPCRIRRIIKFLDPLQLRLSTLLAIIPVTWTCAYEETHSPTHFAQLNKQLLIIACNPADMSLNETPDFSPKSHLCVNAF